MLASESTNRHWGVRMDDDGALHRDFVHVARAALSGAGRDSVPLLRRIARQYRHTHPELAAALVTLLREGATRSALTGRAGSLAEPVDGESRLPLVHVEDPVVLPTEPIFERDVLEALDQLAREHLDPALLVSAGLGPTRTALFTGPPGVGKTLAARWLAVQLDVPLVVLDLASVMSSLLGRTGENVRRVLDFAKQSACILLLDELDAVAKRRDDNAEVGELKRLVTVLLQEIDRWPEGSLLVAATNHDELLDPAIWRRFEVVVRFPLPGTSGLTRLLQQLLDDGRSEFSNPAVAALAPLFRGASYSDVEREVTRSRRIAVFQGIAVEHALLRQVAERTRRLPASERLALAFILTGEWGVSQRQAHEITGVSRDTLRKHSGANREA